MEPLRRPPLKVLALFCAAPTAISATSRQRVLNGESSFPLLSITTKNSYLRSVPISETVNVVSTPVTVLAPVHFISHHGG